MDGIPNQVEAALGLMTNNAADASLDMDMDGMSNLKEFRAGTDINNSNSVLRITQSTVPGMATVSFGAISNKTYTIEYTDAVTNPPPWSRLLDVHSRPTNHTVIYLDPNWSPTRYYHVVTPRQP